MYQYLRKCSLIVSNGDDGLELSELHVTFTVFHRTVQSPSSMRARIYNLSVGTMQKIFKEFTQVVLKAGYHNQDGEIFDIIFKGYIIQSRIGRENPTDTFLEISAADGEPGYDWATIAATLKGGHGNSDIKREINTAFKQQQVDVGYEAKMSETRYPRGRVMYGMARDFARMLGFTTGHTWSIKNGKYETVELRKVLPDEAIVLTSQTGLIGLPQQTPDGVQARALLNPYLIHNRQVKIDNKSIQKLAFPLPATVEGITGFQYASQTGVSLVGEQADGFYRVIAVDHIGDTRGNAWYSDMWLLAINNPNMPLNTSVMQMDIGPDGPYQDTPTVRTTGSSNPNVRHVRPAPPSGPGY